MINNLVPYFFHGLTFSYLCTGHDQDGKSDKKTAGFSNSKKISMLKQSNRTPIYKDLT